MTDENSTQPDEQFEAPEDLVGIDPAQLAPDPRSIPVLTNIAYATVEVKKSDNPDALPTAVIPHSAADQVQTLEVIDGVDSVQFRLAIYTQELNHAELQQRLEDLSDGIEVQEVVDPNADKAPGSAHIL